MGTFLELGVLNYFSIIFPALLVFVVIFTIFEKTKILGDSKTMHAVIAIAAAFLVMLSKDILSIINFGAPWFIMVFIFLTLLLLIYRFMGASEADLTKVITTDKTVQWTVFAVAVLIVITSIAHVYGQKLLEQAEEKGVTVEELKAGESVEGGRTYRGEMYKTIFNPKILGLIFIFLVATFTISLLSRESI